MIRTSRTIGFIKLTLLVTIASSIATGFAFYLHGYKVGNNQASAECLAEKTSLIGALNEANRKNIEMANKQRDGYRVALDMRNTKVAELEAGLTEAESRIRRMMNESEDACVNAAIPDGFK